MGIRSIAARRIAPIIGRKVEKYSKSAITDQAKIFLGLIREGRKTIFGSRYDFENIKKYTDYSKRVPLTDYEGLRAYIDQVKNGQANILWPGVPKYLAKTSGTTSGVKYIPLTRDSMPSHFKTARDAAFNYIYKTGNSSFLDGNLLYLSGSPELDNSGPVPIGRLSGISNHEVPALFRSSQLPSYKINCIENWEVKVEAMIQESLQRDVRMISGIPSWVKMYMESTLDITGKKTIKDVYPNLSLFIYGGVNYEPYRSALEQLIGGRIDSVELFPASEGFFAFQNEQDDQGMLLNTDAGMFFEFVEPHEINSAFPVRHNINTVEAGKKYVLIVSSNAGLWAYNTGDVITFTSLAPYKIIFSGRVSHFISAFGEHVIAKEVEEAMTIALEKYTGKVTEFTVAPQVTPVAGLPYHEWLIEFSAVPEDITGFNNELDKLMTEKNIYYKDLINGAILRPLVITQLKPNSFSLMMKNRGKLGGQNKVPRLTNDRQMANELVKIQAEL